MIGSTAYSAGSSSSDAKRLYDDLLSGYNRLVRPVADHRQPVVVALKLKLSQLIDVVSVAAV
jgi:nicotinic acetylcholine receptor